MDKGRYKDENWILEQIGKLIKHHPNSVASALTHSKVFIENPFNKRELAEKTAYGLVNNRTFQKNIGIVMAHNEVGNLDLGISLTKEDFSSFGETDKVQGGKLALDSGKTIGGATAGGAKSGGVYGAIAGAIIGTITAGFNWASSSKKRKTQEEANREKLYAELLKEEKTNWTPIIVVGAVLIVGGLALFFALKD